MKRRKIVLITLLTICIIIVGAALAIPVYVSYGFENTMKKKLPEWVANASDSLYKVSVTDIKVNFFTKDVSISGLKLYPDTVKLQELKLNSRAPKTVITLSIPRLQASGIMWADIIADKEFSCKRFTVTSPQVTVRQLDRTETRPKEEPSARRMLKMFSAKFIEILQPNIRYEDYFTDSLLIYLKGGKISAGDWSYDPSKAADAKTLLNARSGTVYLDSLVLQRNNSLYTFQTGNISFTSTANSLELRNLKVMPAISKEEYYGRVNQQNELFTVNFPVLSIRGLNWQQLISQGVLDIKSITLDRPYVSIYVSRLPPPEAPKIKKFPNQLLLGLPLQVNIHLLKVLHGEIAYTELNYGTKMEGTLPLKNFNLTGRNVTNIPEYIKQNPECSAEISTELFGSYVGLNIQMSLKDTLGAFSAHGYQNNLDGTKLNPLINPLAKMGIESLQLEKVEFVLDCDGRATQGNFLLLYKNLKLKVLTLNEDGTLGGKGFTSFIINKALLYSENPMPGEFLRRVTTHIPRDHHRSIFSALWSSVRTGALLTAGRNPGVADIVMNRTKANKDKRLAEGK